MKLKNFYIHVPFCRRKCGYCAFYSESDAPAELIDAYLDRLERELAALHLTNPAATVYIGGGTPTLLAERQLRQLGEMVKKHLPLTANTEVSIEANPETLTEEKIGLLTPWVTRLSVGVQSFDAARRAALGRDCGDDAIAAALAWGRRHFAHLNCDLIYGGNGQTPEAWRGELEQAAASGVDHVSCYELTPEENARLRFDSPEEELSVALWRETAAVLAAHGIERYEISNYARSGARARHNCAVWRGEAYLGLGPAAASFDGRRRWSQVEDVHGWLAGAPPEYDDLAPEARTAEIFAVKLRTCGGWSARECAMLFPAGVREKVAVLRRACPEWFREGEGVRLSEPGLLFWNSIAEFLID